MYLQFNRSKETSLTIFDTSVPAQYLFDLIIVLVNTKHFTSPEKSII